MGGASWEAPGACTCAVPPLL